MLLDEWTHSQEKPAACSMSCTDMVCVPDERVSIAPKFCERLKCFVDARNGMSMNRTIASSTRGKESMWGGWDDDGELSERAPVAAKKYAAMKGRSPKGQDSFL